MNGASSNNEDGRGDQEFLIAAFSDAMVSAARTRPLPIASPQRTSIEQTPFETHFEVLDLSSAGSWDDLDARIRDNSRQNNMGPWWRCISLLRGQGAVSCVIEHHYVCLDHRGERASFNSQLDAFNGNSALRLHFFSMEITDAHVLSLPSKVTDEDKYLGYIVCRDAGAPVVGRTVLRVPHYIHTSTAIDEPVNFFGQRLWVRGVPFMQQDARYAICAQVALWSVHYSLFRRGVVERKLVSDVVGASQALTPMRPVIPLGLHPHEAIRVLAALGLGSFEYDVSLRDSVSDLDEIKNKTIATIGEALVSELEGVLRFLQDQNPEEEGWQYAENPGAFAVQLFRRLLDPESASRLHEYSVAKRSVDEYIEIAKHLIDLAILTLVEPFVRSGFPAYCDTQGHAITLCGLGSDDSGAFFYFHDDQFGPYLATRTVVGASRESFQRQAYARRQDVDDFADVAPDVDRAEPASTPVSTIGSDYARSVYSMIIPRPPRLLLSPNAALNLARSIYSQASSAIDGFDRISDIDFQCSIMMGIDYKSMRRRQSPAGSVASKVFSTVHLAEWVVLVEVVSDLGRVNWEVVFDGSSGDGNAIIQLVRIGRLMRCVHPRSFPAIEQCTLDFGEFFHEDPVVRVRKAPARDS